MAGPLLWLIVPCYNESEVLPITAPHFLNKLESLIKQNLISPDSRILFVDDGSKDSTWSIIKCLAQSNDHFIGIQQSRNRGHQLAVLAGLLEAKNHCDITISIDCDGQDDLNAIDEMIAHYNQGSEIVYGVRSDRETDSFLKRSTAQAYYRLMRWMGVDLVYNHADYRLVSTKVLEHFADYREVNVFLRGMFPLIGFKSSRVYYKRQKREAGKSHYSIGKMFGLALDGITSMSTRPINYIALLGFISSFAGFLGIIWVLVTKLIGKTVAGWASLACLTLFMAGVQLLSLAMIGIYVGKSYMESKRRPRFIISDKTYTRQEFDKKEVGDE